MSCVYCGIPLCEEEKYCTECRERFFHRGELRIGFSENTANDKIIRKRIIIFLLLITAACVVFSILLATHYFNVLADRNRAMKGFFGEVSSAYLPGGREVLEEYKEYFEILSSGGFAKKEASNRGGGLPLENPPDLGLGSLFRVPNMGGTISFKEQLEYGVYESHSIRGRHWQELEWLSVDEIEAIQQLSRARFPLMYHSGFNNIRASGQQSLLVRFGRGLFLGRHDNQSMIFNIGIERDETLEKEVSMNVESAPHGSIRSVYIYRERIEGPYFLYLTLERRAITDGSLGFMTFALVIGGIAGCFALYLMFKTKRERQKLKS